MKKFWVIQAVLLLFAAVEASADPVAIAGADQKALQIRQPGPAERPVVTPGLQPEIFTKGIGNIADIAIGETGILLVLDSKAGRLLEITDRELRGKADMTRTLADGFTGAVQIVKTDTQIFVVDSSAIWSVDPAARTKSEFVSLRNTGALPAPRPVALDQETGNLWLGLNFKDGTSKIVTVNSQTGRAEGFAGGNMTVNALSKVSGSPLWAAVENGVLPVMSGQYLADRLYPTEYRADRLYQPVDFEGRGISSLNGQFLIIQGQNYQADRGQPSGRNVIAVGASFGMPGGDAKQVAGGFISNYGRAAWGQPAAIAADSRGMFLADGPNGVIWRISQLVPKITIAERPADKPVKFYEDDEIKKPKAEWGSSIEKGSAILKGSALGETWESDSLMQSETLMEKLRREDDPKKPSE